MHFLRMGMEISVHFYMRWLSGYYLVMENKFWVNE